MTAPASILLSVGTDFHAFDRAVSWLDTWLEAHPEHQVGAIVQHGTSAPSRHGSNHQYLAHADLQTALDEARVAIVHGGPATIFEAVEHGHVPVCVPRDPTLGEHVDSHQQRFSRYLAGEGIVHLALTQDEFDRAVTDAMRTGRGQASTARSLQRTQSMATLADLVTSAIEIDRRPLARRSSPLTSVGRLLRRR